MNDCKTRGIDDAATPAEAGHSKAASSGSRITTSGLYDLIQSQGHRCALSGQQIEPDTAALDHKQPIEAGGKHVMENVWWLHKDVNAAKGTMTVEEFVAMCKRVASHCGTA